MLLTVRTDDRPERERFEYWRDIVSDTFVPLRCEPTDGFDQRTFAGRMRSLRLGALQVTDLAVTPHLVERNRKLISRSAGDYVKFVAQLGGTCVLSQDGREAPLRVGDFALYDTVRPYSLRLGPSYRTLVLLIPRHLLLMPAARIAALTAHAIPSRHGVSALLASMLREFVHRLDEFDEVADVRLADNIVDLVNTLLIERAGTPAAHPDSMARTTLLRVISFIEEHLGDPDLGPDQVAAVHFISTRYLQKLFQQEGATVAGWIRGRRLEHCRRDLRDPVLLDRPVSAVGARWGLIDAAHFSRVFRAAYGMSPREYRNEAVRLANAEQPAPRLPAGASAVEQQRQVPLHDRQGLGDGDVAAQLGRQ